MEIPTQATAAPLTVSSKFVVMEPLTTQAKSSAMTATKTTQTAVLRVSLRFVAMALKRISTVTGRSTQEMRSATTATRAIQTLVSMAAKLPFVVMALFA